MLTRETDYAIRIIDYIKREGGGKIVPVSQIAEAVLVPYRFARKIARQLCIAGILTSTRGKTGGLKLNPDIKEINYYDVVSIIDPRGLVINRCVYDPDCCERSGYCAMHERFKTAQVKYEKLLKELKI